MSVPRLVKIWSLEIPEDGPEAMSVDVWVPNQIALCRAVATAMADQLSGIPPSETRLRNEAILPLYSLFRTIPDTLKSIARARGVTTFLDTPNAPEDWSEDASTDWKALTAQLDPHLVEPVRMTIGWILGLRDRDPKVHWTSKVAIASVSLELYTRMVKVMSGVLEGREWQPFVALVDSDELRGITRVIDEEILRIRDQPGSGWNEEEANRLVKEQLGNKKALSKHAM